ncbi:hypothetical protein [Microlunatus ginsengisoli]|uniref:Lactococcin 972 family bacteriocin n=1 Tax=Microlunatus ginsengisoli TaxID=363863 RepID=A0ABP6ZSG8_9ACTN
MTTQQARPRRWGRRALATAALTTAAGLAFTVPAEATVYYSLHAWYDYSRASASSTAGEWTQSWAVHGNRSAVSGWGNVSSYAYADSGWSGYYGAGVRIA